MVYDQGIKPHYPRIRDHGLGVVGLWLLTNQLYRPTTKSVTPAFGFGVAVDGGGGSSENILPFLRSIPKKCHCGQVGALKEGPIPDAGNAIRNRDARQAFAATEGRTPDAGELTVRPESDAGQARAAREGRTPDAGDAVRDRDAR